MAVTPESLLKAAELLLEGGSEEDHRNAVSRAYYAAFHKCMPVALALGLQPYTNRGTHQDLIDILQSSRTKAHKALANMLIQCRKLRVEADYRIEGSFEEGDARTGLASCSRIFEKVDNLATTQRES